MEVSKWLLYSRIVRIVQADDSLCTDKRNQVIVHELTHAIFMEAGFEEQDEDMINRVGNVLFQVLSDNKF